MQGGDFVIDFRFNPTILVFSCEEESYVYLAWSRFSSLTMAYEILYCDDLTNPVWHPVVSAEMFPIFTLNWKGDDIRSASQRFYRVIGMRSCITEVTPNTAQPGDFNVPVQITGWNTSWTSGNVSVSFGAGVSVSSPVTVVDSTHLTATISVNPRALVGYRDVTIETTSGETLLKRDAFRIIR